ncbi:unnamed protein product [Clonostachys solani]|uniref:Fucose-specific lectin n=1 Tax=Clonostachys solani TaxID=160281 RepID=A0A9N9ZHZ8_9HYPO|nr:unnamed protein product [Clonostachys solani]
MAPDQRTQWREYSDLEVVPGFRPRQPMHGEGLEVYEYGDLEVSHHADPTAKLGKIISPVGDPKTLEGKILSTTELRERTLPLLPPATIWGFPRKTFWILSGVIAFSIIAIAVGGGVGGYFGSQNNSSSSSSTGASQYQNLSITALHWVDGATIGHYRVYYQPPNATHILESSWSTDKTNWTVSYITEEDENIKDHSPLTSAAGYPHTNVTNDLVKSVFYLKNEDEIVEQQNPYKENLNAWGHDNLSGLYKTSNISSVMSYWYQNFDTRIQILALFFQELGANSLSVARYIENKTDSRPWVKAQQSVPVQDGTSVAVAPVGSRRDLRLYVGGTDGTLKQYPYDIQTNELGDVTNTVYELAPRTPICVTTEDNRNYFTVQTLPECAQTNTGAFITHLILFASTDRKNLTLVSWNCSSGFSDETRRIQKLMKPNREYLGLTTTSASNLTFEDDRVYVLYDGGNGPEAEEWQIPTSGGKNTTGQNGEWKLLSEVPLTT